MINRQWPLSANRNMYFHFAVDLKLAYSAMFLLVNGSLITARDTWDKQPQRISLVCIGAGHVLENHVCVSLKTV